MRLSGGFAPFKNRLPPADAPFMNLFKGRRRLAIDEGFTLVEAVVSLMVAAVVFTSSAMVLVSSISATLMSRSNQQAEDAMSSVVEQVRNMDFAAVALTSAADVAALTSAERSRLNITGTSPSYSVDPDGSGPLAAEPLVFGSPGGVPVKSTIASGGNNGVRFTVYRLVSRPVDTVAKNGLTNNGYVRLSLLATWSQSGSTHYRGTNTFVTAARRGLPLPKYTWIDSTDNTVTQSRTVGQTVSFGARLHNFGYRTDWFLSASVKNTSNGAVRPWAFRWYLDNGAGANACNGMLDSDESTGLDPNGDGTYDTNLIATDEERCVVAVYTLPVTEPVGQVTVTLIATPRPPAGGTPDPSTATSATPGPYQASVGAQSCGSGCVLATWHLHSNSTNAPTVSTADLLMNPTPPAAANTVLEPYSTDVDANAGRTVLAGGAGPSEVNPTLVANWVYTLPTAVTVRSSTAYLDLAAVLANYDPLGSTTVTVHVLTENTAGTFVANAPVSVTFNPGSSSFVHAVIPVPVAGVALPAGRRVVVKVELPAGVTPLKLAYDLPAYDSVFELPTG